MRRTVLVAAAVVVAGCKAPSLKVVDACLGYAAKSCISLEVTSSAPLSIEQLELAGTSGFTFEPLNDVLSPSSAGAAVALPVVVPVLPGDTFGGAFSLAVRGLRGGGAVASGSVDGSVSTGDHVAATVMLRPGLGADPDPMRSTVTVDRPTGVAANGADAAKLTVVLVDSTGAALAGRRVTVAAMPDGAAIAATGLTDATGSATTTITSTTKGTYTITTTVESSGGPVALATTPTVAFVTPGKLAFVGQPHSVLVGERMDVTVSIVDPVTSEVITDANTPITVSLAGAIGATALSGDVIATPVGGVATFHHLNIDDAGQRLTLTATAPSLTAATSQSFDVTARPWARWSTGLDGATGIGVTIDPTDPMRLYAALGVGVYASTDGGLTWRSASYGLSQPIWAIAVDRSSPATLYASGQSSGLWKSTNRGASWTPLPFPANAFARRLFVDPNRPAIVLADVTTDILRSTDGGQTWTTSLPSAYFLTAGPGAAYSTTNGQLMKTTDGGATWAMVGTAPASFVFADPSIAKTLYVAAPEGVRKSLDDGATWALVNAGLPPTTTLSRIAVAPSDSKTVYALYGDGQLYVSANGGDSWTATASVASFRGGDNLAVAPDDAKRVWVISLSDGLFETTDGGQTWRRGSSGVPPSPQQLRVDAGVGQVYALTPAGAYVIEAAMTTAWRPLPRLPVGVRLTDFNGTWAAASDGAYRFDSATSTWTKSTSASAPTEWLSVAAVDANDARHLIVGGAGTIYDTTDGGVTWTKSTLCSGSITGAHVRGSNAFATCNTTSGSGAGGLFASTDGGAHWSNTAGATGAIPASVQPLCLVMSGDENTVHVGGSDGLVYSDLFAAGTWSRSPAVGAPPIASLAVDPSVARHFFAADADGVIELAAGGGVWNSVSNGLTARPYLLVTPGAGAKTLFAATGAGVYKTVTGGQ